MRQALESLIGIDTTFLVAHSILEHPEHRQATQLCRALLEGQNLFALCNTVIDEFIHVVTDPKRFEQPLSIHQASQIMETWLQSEETRYLPPDEDSARLHLQWLSQHRLGRKRINDTRIAATYYSHGVRRLLTSNVRDYAVLDAFAIIEL